MNYQVTCRARALGTSTKRHQCNFCWEPELEDADSQQRNCSLPFSGLEGWSCLARGNDSMISLYGSVFCVPELQLLDFQTQTSMHSVSLAGPTQQGRAKPDSFLLCTSAALLPAELQGRLCAW